MFEVRQNPIEAHSPIDRLKRETSGAVVSFIGSVRGYSANGKRVLFVEAEDDGGVVEGELEKVASEIQGRWQLEDVALCHRIGRIGVGETILVVAVAAAHRQEAFAACQYAVDRIKERVPIREALEA